MITRILDNRSVRPVLCGTFVALAAAALLLPGCKSNGTSSTQVHSATPGAGNPGADNGATAPGEKPVAATDLLFDFHPGRELPRRALGGLLSFSLRDFSSRWGEAASSRGGSPVSLEPNGILDRGYRDARATLDEGVRLHGLLVGNEGLHGITVLAAPYDKKQNEALFKAWETLIDTIDPSATAADHRAIYEGLGLFKGKIAGAQGVDHKGHRYLVALRPVRGRDELSFTVEPLPSEAKAGSVSIAVPDGSLGDGQFLESFYADMPKESVGKTFREALSACQSQGLDLCTDPQWRRACAVAPEIGSVETWTSSFTADYKQLQVRGTGGCEAGQGAVSTDTKPERGGLCCTRSIALAGETATIKGPAHAVLLFERAANLKSAPLLEQAFAPVLSEYYTTRDIPRAKAVQVSLNYLQATEGAYSMHDSCSMGAAAGLGFPVLECVHTTLTGEKAMVSRSHYGVGASGLVSIRDPLVYRRRGAF